MKRSDVLNLAKKVYGENDKRVDELNTIFNKATNDIVNALSEFIADQVNWSSKAPKDRVQELMDEIAKVAVEASVDERPFINQTFRDERVKTYGDVAKQKVNLIAVNLALAEKNNVQETLENVDINSKSKLPSRSKEKSISKHRSYYRKQTGKAVEKIVRENHPGWQGASWQDRIYKEKSALMRQLDEQVDDILKNHYKPQDFKKEIADKLNTSRKRAETILRTETCGQLSRRLIDDYTKRDVKNYKIESALSTNTCEECEDLDGKQYSLDEAVEGVTLPPFHPNCQCTLLEVPDDGYNIDFSKMSNNEDLD